MRRIYELVDEFAGEPCPTLDATTFGKWGRRPRRPRHERRAGDGGRAAATASWCSAGVSTDCCVLSTALAAADAGVEVQVVADACAGVDDESHAKALDIMRALRPAGRGGQPNESWKRPVRHGRPG